ncbi:UNVERIFIED_CONTAM: hypothetical protein Scaly_2794100 [Sesamum calycinum]|uniref:Reverse transcriptase domain-containing protein n=1 Tax=Sesamum calycinum TaxID=2727403 RepID=A0AAW2IXG4_9LAMI
MSNKRNREGLVTDPDTIKTSGMQYFAALLSVDEEHTTLEEVRSVVFKMDANNIAGRDGISAFFYQKCWDTIKDDVLEVVEDFMNGSPISVSFTVTSIVFILKVRSPTIWQIGDNILLPQEILQSIGKHKTDCNVVLKVDIAKAYNRVDWSFLRKVLSHFGFLPRGVWGHFTSFFTVASSLSALSRNRKRDRDIAARFSFHYQWTLNSQPLIVRWSRSDLGWMKLNCDGPLREILAWQGVAGYYVTQRVDGWSHIILSIKSKPTELSAIEDRLELVLS